MTKLINMKLGRRGKGGCRCGSAIWVRNKGSKEIGPAWRGSLVSSETRGESRECWGYGGPHNVKPKITEPLGRDTTYGPLPYTVSLSLSPLSMPLLFYYFNVSVFSCHSLFSHLLFYNFIYFTQYYSFSFLSLFFQSFIF